MTRTLGAGSTLLIAVLHAAIGNAQQSPSRCTGVSEPDPNRSGSSRRRRKRRAKPAPCAPTGSVAGRRDAHPTGARVADAAARRGSFPHRVGRARAPKPSRGRCGRGLQQPWSIAFLPDGAMLVTERCGQLRIIRNGILDLEPVAGVPEVRAAGLQGLMDVVLHPRFAENNYVYLSYHKPVPAPDAASTVPVATNAGANQPQQATPQVGGATTIARGVWSGGELTEVRDIFESGVHGD